ncbi:MAG: PilX N-terminal domain-containing pilus assembly protein [Methylomonas sp.]|nr:PilX N-terminal domain-containing pilus assembly protein [Methylomonas sp.]
MLKQNHLSLPDTARSFQSQTGAVLPVALIVMLLMTMIGTSGARVSGLDEKMAGNMRDRNLAFQAAESALAAAENSLNSPNVLPTFKEDGTGGFYADTSTIPNSLDVVADSFWTTNPVATSNVASLGNGIATPKYIIQKLTAVCFNSEGCSTTPMVVPYKITVRATGGTTNAVVILQSIYTPS